MDKLVSMIAVGTLSFVLVWGGAQVALADNVVNNVTAGGTDTFEAGLSTTVKYKIVSTSSVQDPQETQAGCNAADDSPAVVTINIPPEVTVSPTSQTFTICNSFKSFTFTSITPGDYLITVTVDDPGDPGGPVGFYNTNPARFTLHVLPSTDTVPPVMNVPADFSVPTDAGIATATVDYSSQVSATDNVYLIGFECTPPSPSTLGLGPNVITCTATDVAGNIDTESFTVTVIDTEPPVIDPSTVPTSIVVSTDPGLSTATVNYVAPSATDNVGVSSISCNPPSGTSFSVDTTTVTCTATDAAGNSDTESFTVTVNDTEAPVITVPTPVSVPTDPGSATAAVSYSASAVDNVDGSVPVTCNPPSGSAFPVDTTTVNCTATDLADNSASASFTVTVNARPTVLVLNQPPTVVADTQMTISGRLTDGISDEGINGATILFSGTGAAGDFPASVVTQGVTFTDTGGINIVDVGGDNQIQLNVGTVITFPSGTHGVTFLVTDELSPGFTIEWSTLEGSVNIEAVLPGARESSLISGEEITEIEVTSVNGNPSGSVLISTITTSDPESDPKEQHVLDFEALSQAESPYASPLTLNAGFFFAVGRAPVTPATDPANPLIMEADFGGSPGFLASSDQKAFNTLEPTLSSDAGTVGEASSIYDFVGQIYTQQSIPPGGDDDNDRILDVWEQFPVGATAGIPVVNSQSGATTYKSLCHIDPFSNVDFDGPGPYVAHPANETVCPRPNHKDVYVELEWMEFHRLDPEAIKMVIKAFGNGDITNPQADHFGRTKGATLHVIESTQQCRNHQETINAWQDPTVGGIADDGDPNNDFKHLKAKCFGAPSEIASISGAGSPSITDAGPGDTSRGFKISNVQVTTPGTISGVISINTKLTFSGTVGSFTAPAVTKTCPGGATCSLTLGTASVSFSGSGTTKTALVKVPFSRTGAGSATTTLQDINVSFTIPSTDSSDTLGSIAYSDLTGPTVLTDIQLAWAQVAHLGFSAHSYGVACSPSGLAEKPGNDFLITLGCGFGGTNPVGHSGTNYSVGDRGDQAGTFMHELGHNLGLGHGGPLKIVATNTLTNSADNNMNCKPNYLSVMTHPRQLDDRFASLAQFEQFGLDYSRQALATLGEGGLNEATGIPVNALDYPGGQVVIFGTSTSPFFQRVNAGSNINFDQDGSSSESSVVADINNMSGISNCGVSAGQSLVGFEDWTNLQYSGVGVASWNDGVNHVFSNPYGQPEATFEIQPFQRTLEISGVLEPVNQDGTTERKLGDTVPFKLRLVDQNGNPITNAKITFTWTRAEDGASFVDTRTLFKFNKSDNLYHYNWSTKGLIVATYQIQLFLDYGTAVQTLLDGPPFGDRTTVTVILRN